MESKTPSVFVLYRQPSEGEAEIIYVGSDKGAALDALLAITSYCEISELEIKEGNYEN